jgi:hypothetical protein
MNTKEIKRNADVCSILKQNFNPYDHAILLILLLLLLLLLLLTVTKVANKCPGSASRLYPSNNLFNGHSSLLISIDLYSRCDFGYLMPSILLTVSVYTVLVSFQLRLL